MDNLIRKLRAAHGNDLNLYVLLRNKRNREYHISTMNLERDFAISMVDNLREQIEVIINHEDFVEMKYCPITKFDNGIVETLELEEINKVNEIEDLVESNPEEYNGNFENDFQIWAFIFVIEIIEIVDGNEELLRILTFHKFNERKLVEENNNRLKKLCGINGIYQELDHEILVINTKIDCIYFKYDNDDLNVDLHMYIFNKHYFELIFGFEEKFRNFIKEKLENIQNNMEENEIGPLIDFDKLNDFVQSNRNHLRKLYKIVKEDKFDLLNEENIKKTKDESRILIKMKNKKVVLNHDNVKKLFNMLNEDYLANNLTNNQFKSNSKTIIE